jgi:hypothetical protein
MFLLESVYVWQNDGSPVFSIVPATESYKLVTAMLHVCYSLNRMHIMEDEGSKPSATLESVPKASRSPTPCQNAVQAVDSEKRGVCGEENAATATNKDEGQQKSPSNELLETSKTVTAEEEETLKEKEGTVKFLCFVTTVAMILTCFMIGVWPDMIFMDIHTKLTAYKLHSCPSKRHLYQTGN